MSSHYILNISLVFSITTISFSLGRSFFGIFFWSLHMNCPGTQFFWPAFKEDIQCFFQKAQMQKYQAGTCALWVYSQGMIPHRWSQKFRQVWRQPGEPAKSWCWYVRFIDVSNIRHTLAVRSSSIPVHCFNLDLAERAVHTYCLSDN